MSPKELREKFSKLLKNGPPDAGEICVIWIAGIVAYALCTSIEPFYMEDWFEFHFLTFSSIPPGEHEWRIKTEHLHGNEFVLNGNAVIILALKIYVSPGSNDPDTVKVLTWEEMIDGDKDGEDGNNGGGRCPNQCDTPCS